MRRGIIPHLPLPGGVLETHSAQLPIWRTGAPRAGRAGALSRRRCHRRPRPRGIPAVRPGEPGDIPLFQAASGTATPGTGGRAPTSAPAVPPAGPAGSDGAPFSAPLTRTATPTAAATATLGPPRATPTLRPGARPESDDRGPRYAGWATEAYPQDSAEKMEQMMTRQRANGANVVWIGHNNPGKWTRRTPSPGLSYAVYEALQNPDGPAQRRCAGDPGGCRAAAARGARPGAEGRPPAGLPESDGQRPGTRPTPTRCAAGAAVASVERPRS